MLRQKANINLIAPELDLALQIDIEHSLSEIVVLCLMSNQIQEQISNRENSFIDHIFFANS